MIKLKNFFVKQRTKIIIFLSLIFIGVVIVSVLIFKQKLITQDDQPKDLTWQTKTIQEKSNYADIDIEYPEFIGAGNSIKNLNKYIYDIIAEKLKDDRSQVEDWIKNGKYWIDDQGNKQYEQYAPDRWLCRDSKEYDYNCSVNLSVRYKVYSAVDDIVSLKLISTDYTGGGNGNHNLPIIINYDLKTNREIKTENIFCTSNYLDKLASLVKPAIYKVLGKKEKDNLIEESTAPNKDNYNNVLLNNSSLIVVFSPYAVSSGATGTIEIPISYSLVENLLCPPVKDYFNNEAYKDNSVSNDDCFEYLDIPRDQTKKNNYNRPIPKAGCIIVNVDGDFSDNNNFSKPASVHGMKMLCPCNLISE